MGELEDAERHLKRALDLLDSSGSARTEEEYRILWPLMRVIADRASFEQTDYPTAMRYLALVPRMFGEEYPELRDAFPPPSFDVAPDVELLIRLSRAELEPRNPLRIVMANYLWSCGWYVGLHGGPDDYTQLAFEEALGIRRSELPESHPDIASTLNGLVDVLNRAGRFERAEELIEESLGIRRTILPGDEAGIATCLSLLGECLAGQGRREEAEELLVSSYHTLREAKSSGHPELVAALSRLVRAYDGWKQEDEARVHRRRLAKALASSPFERKWPAPRLAFGPEHGALFEALDRLAGRQLDVGPPPARLQENWRSFVAERERSLPADHPLALLCAQHLSEWGSNLRNGGGDIALCEAIFREALAIQEAHPSQSVNDWTYGTLWGLASICERDGRLEEGARWARRAMSAARDLDGGEGWFSANPASVLGGCLIGQGRYAEAESLVVKSALTGLEQRSIIVDDVLRACYRVRDLYAVWGDPRNAEAVWNAILYETAELGVHGPFIVETVHAVVSTPGLETATYDLARDFVTRRLSGPRSDAERRRLLSYLLLTHLRTGAYEEVRASLPALEAEFGNATPIEWAAFAMALAALGENDAAMEAVSLAKSVLAEEEAEVAATRWIAEAESALR